MLFNKSVIKKLSVKAGVKREGKGLDNIIRELATDFTLLLIDKIWHLLVFCNRKTITVDDIQYLNKLFPETYPLVIPSKVKEQPCTSKKTFALLVKNHMEDYRLGKNVIETIQTITEAYLIGVMQRALLFADSENRSTLLPRDIHNALFL